MRGLAEVQSCPAHTRLHSLASHRPSHARTRAGSFTQIFQAALALGIISRRRAYAEALAHERERNGGLPPFLGRFTSRQARAAADVAECGDYHVGLAHRLLNAPTQVRRFCALHVRPA